MRTVRIAPFGSEQEALCQQLLWRGVAFIQKEHIPSSIWQRSRNAPGGYAENWIIRLERALTPPGTYVPADAMRVVKFHLAFIHQFGIERWLEEASKNAKQPSDFFEWQAEEEKDAIS
ncbi:MAG: hypothetical protein EXR67_00005 [Dehalococcoidia bacterium]|nr:hypothetical protein [Dehalococcoidia bacterium]